MSYNKIRILSYIKENVSYFDWDFFGAVSRWLKNGKLHREDGPAYVSEEADIKDTYVLNGAEYASPSTWRRGLQRLWKRERNNKYFQ